MLRVSQPAAGLPKPRDALGFRRSTPPVLTPRHGIVDGSSSEDEEQEEEIDDKGGEEARRHAARRQQRVSQRPKTVLQFAHPVASRRRLKLRLKLLLQLHELNRASRPFPKYDVFPADMPTRLICKLPKPYGSTRAFGAKDIVVVTSDMYEQQQTLDDRSVSSDESSCLEQREVIATICQCGSDDSAARKSKFEVAFSSGVCWEGIALPNGSYELVSKGGPLPSRKVRWVARDKMPVRQGTGSSSASSMSAGRFTFSVINAHTRQHPVIASMTRKGLTVFDQFSYPAGYAYSGDELSPPASPSTTASSAADRGLVNTDADLRQVIVMTGIWVAFMEGWAAKSLHHGGETPSRSESTMSPRRRSSTFVSADGDAAAAAVESGSVAGSSGSGRPSRLNSFSLKKEKATKRRSTQSEFGWEMLTEQNRDVRRSKSLTSADRRVKWTDAEPARDAQVGPDRQDAGRQEKDEGEAKVKARGWRRLSSILRRKKR